MSESNTTTQERIGDNHAVVSTTSEQWSGPHTEYDKYGHPTGEQYVRCRDCGIEVLAEYRDDATHRDTCRHE